MDGHPGATTRRVRMEASTVVFLVWVAGFVGYSVVARFRTRVHFEAWVHRRYGAEGVAWVLKRTVRGLVWPVAVVMWFVR